jgi:hypothetical protein
MKLDHMMRRNYLKIVSGDQVNTVAPYNLIKWMRFKKQEIFDLIFGCYFRTIILVRVENFRMKF